MTKEKEYYMIKEIREQPDLIGKLLNEYVKHHEILLGKKELEEKIRKTKRIILLGCGTSYHAALFGNYIIEELARLNCEIEHPHEFNSRKKIVEDDTLIIALSQSGKTTDLIKAIENIKEKNVLVLSIVNAENSPLGRLSDILFYCEAGEEKAVAATKSFSAELFLLVLLALKIGLIKNNISKEKTEEILMEIRKIPEKMRAVLQNEKNIKIIAEKFYNFKNVILLGRKYSYPIALEGALKLKEATYIHAEGYASEEFIHGPNAIIDRDFPSIFIMPKDDVYQGNFRIYEKINKEKAMNIIITTENNALKKENTIYLPETMELLTPFLSVISLQILAYYIAVYKKIDLDNLRNISKYVEKK